MGTDRMAVLVFYETADAEVDGCVSECAVVLLLVLALGSAIFFQLFC